MLPSRAIKAGRRALLAIVAAFGGVVYAQECTFELEPNDTPAQATRITGAGPDSSARFGSGVAHTACLAGELAANDQDAFNWEVGELESGQRWVVDLESFPGRLTSLRIFRIDFAPDGSGVTAAEELFYTETRDGRQTTSAEFLVGPGTYHIGISASGGTGAYAAHLRPVERIVRDSSVHRPGQELRDAFAVHGPAQGELAQTFTLDTEQAEFLWGLELRTAIGSEVTLVLEGPGGRLFEARTGPDGRVRRGSLGLTAGTYRALVQGESPLVILRLEPQGKPATGGEIEPNDSWATATLFPLGSQMRGEAGAGADFYRIEVDEAAAADAWDLALEASGNLTLRLYTEEGSLLTGRSGAAGKLSGLQLEPGAYRLDVRGGEGIGYTLSLGRASPSPAGYEREPNDDVIRATPLGEESQIRGVLTPQDSDVFSLEVTEAQLYRVQAVGPGARRLTMLYPNGNAMLQEDGDGRVRLDDLLLLPGTHYFRLNNVNVEGEYALRAMALGPAPTPPVAEAMPTPEESLRPATAVPAESPGADSLAVAAPTEPPPPAGWLEHEPNGDSSRSMRLRNGDVHVGRISPSGEVDVYRFHLLADEYVRIELVPPEDGIGFDLVGPFPTARQAGNEPGSPVVVEGWFLAGDHVVVVRAGTAGSTGYYQLRLTQLGILGGLAGTEPGSAGPTAAGSEDLKLSFELSSQRVAAYWHEGQLLTAAARIENTGSQTQRVSFSAAVNDARTQVDAPAAVTVAPGQSLELPLRIILPTDLRDDLLLRVELAATSESAHALATFEVVPRCEAEPVSPRAYWPVPQGLRGRLDMLWDAAGASVFGEAAEVHRDPYLLDGRVGPGHGANVTTAHSPTFELAGGRPVRLVGTLLHPRSDTATASQLKGFLIETSLDGVNYTPVLEAELLAAAVEQAFEFPAPVTARYARLVFVSNHGGGSSARLGEWKLLAEDPAPLGEMNLALPGLGGHVAWSEPLLPSFGLPVIGDEFDEVRAIDLRGYEGLTFVVGFHNGRAAQITRLEWRESPRTAEAPEVRFQEVRIEASLAGPAGPWQPLADWNLERNADGLAVIELAAPTWVRYLKLFAPAWGEGRSFWPPDQLKVIERQADAEYLSAMGEWGMDAREAVYEAFLETQPRAPAATTAPAAATTPDASGDDAGDSPAQATPLASGQSAHGTVEVAVDVDWYRITVPVGENHLELRLAGDPAIAYRYHLTDAEGRAVAFDTEEGAGGTTLTLFAEPGDYLLGLEEPKRTVVFSWDTSGSVGPFQDITYSALASFALELDGDREAVQLLAFNDPAPKWLLPIWSSDPQRVQRAIAEFDRVPNSSDSEGALLAATRALAGRDGTRAILLITDAASTGYGVSPDLWRAFHEATPRIFTFQVSTATDGIPQDLMQAWAAVNGGSYAAAAGVGDIDAGFARVSCLLRRPKRYRVEVETSFVAPPGPGSLSVVRTGDAPEAAVEVIFDASGSMGRALPGGEQRIAAAKRALEALVGQVLPDDAQFALRAFGHVAPSSCETRLDVPLGPLDRGAALVAVRAIEPKLLSQTPLAAALAAVAADLSGATGPRTVILITDGVESCGGDPAAAVRELRAAGPLDLAIVSLGLEPDALAVFEALAADIGASYVDVGSFEDLAASIETALNPVVEFEVLDAAGEVVARGIVDGEPVELTMGLYTVRVMAAQVEVFEAVRVPGEQSVTVAVGR